jgi:uncharacterized phage protein (TIGR02218 family)
MKDLSPLALTSAVVGFPARIIEITRTDGTIIRIAESDEPLVVDGDTYSVVPGFQVSAIKHTNNGETPSCQFVAVHGSSGVFDTQDLDAGLFDGAAVQIYQVDRLNLSRKGLLFTGSISDIQWDPVDRGVVFDVRGPSSSAKVIMTRKRSPMCQTHLFSVLCGLDAADFDVATTVAAMSDNDAFSFTVTGSLANPTGRFNQGAFVTANNVAIEIAKWDQSTQKITTYLPCDQFITVGMALTLYPGCNKVLEDDDFGCASLSNQLNFQGEPHFLGTAAAAQQVVSASGGPTGV